MQGEREPAAKSLTQAKSLDPQLQLSSQEILDQSVLDFFASIPAGIPKEVQPEPQEIPKEEPHIAAEPPPAPPAPPPRAQPVAPKQKRQAAVAQQPAAPVRQDSTKKAAPQSEVPAAWMEEPEQAAEEEPQSAPVASHVTATHTSEAEQEQKQHPPHLAYYFLPFGVGQYLNHAYALGITSTVSQAASLILGLYYYNSANQIVETTNGEVASREIIANTQFSNVTAQQAYQNSQTQLSNTAYNNAYIALGLFTSIWISSVVESLLHRQDSEEASKAAKPLSHASKQHFSLQLSPNPHTFSLASPAGLVTWTINF